MILAHVICCNDSVEAVVLGTVDEAEEKAKEMKQNYVAKHCLPEDRAEALYFHVHTVPVMPKVRS